MIKVFVVFGTRPEAIKMAPLVYELKKYPDIDCKVCVTAQHRQMLDMVLELFKITPDFDLDIMKERQTLAGITTRALTGLEEVFREEKPDLVLVHGDTTTTFAGALAAYYNQIKVGHVEAGLRTWDKYFPFPEEMNRKLTGSIADLHFSPTISNRANLLKEGTSPERIFVTGNTVIDAFKTTVRKDFSFEGTQLEDIDWNKRIVLMTAHRRENLGEPLYNICRAAARLVRDFPDIELVYPVHLNPAVQDTAREVLGALPRVHLVDPLDVDVMHNAMSRCHLVMTDSGGLQEEAPALGKPVLVLRGETERPEAAEAGTVKIAGVHEEVIYSLASQLLTDEAEYQKMSHAVNPYGDGNASRRIAEAILYHFGIREEAPSQWL
ncbi:MAG: UDP-N-acetylglucosamine 2-epimerase (non-hydrolyzing) [Oscillospiraceae bacterium]|nr:UDP-N-acetylglucosamine 2-epimerase (non-hydrolyzing) [Oscillospiraceae bacterium]